MAWVHFFHHIGCTSKPYRAIISLASCAGCLNPPPNDLNDSKRRGSPISNNTNGKLYYHW